jgi:hypothetical protein
MNRTLQARLARLEKARLDPAHTMTDEELHTQIQKIASDLGGFEAVMASLDDSSPEDRQMRELLREYAQNRFGYSP